MKKQIIKLCVLILFPLIVSAGYSGGGSGCMGCGGGGGGDAIDTGGEMVADDGTGSDTPLSTAGVSKDLLGMMPDMDSIVLIKMDELSKTAFGKDLFDSLDESGDDAGTAKGTVGKGLVFAAKEALPPDMKGVFILGIKFSWPKAFGEDESPQVKELMGLIIVGDGDYMKIQSKLEEKFKEDDTATGKVKKIKEIELSEIKGPEFCDKDEDKDCTNTPMFYGMTPDKKMFIVSTGGAAEEFITNYLAKEEEGSLNAVPKSVSKSAEANAEVKQYLASVTCGVACGVITTPLASMIKASIEKNDPEFMEGFGNFWLSTTILPKAGAIAMGLDIGATDYSFNTKVHFLDKVIPSVSASISFEKIFFENVNWGGLFEKLFGDDNKCHEKPTTSCQAYTTKDTCEQYYYMWPKGGGGSNPHNCMWSDEGYQDNAGVTLYCYTHGSNADENVCEWDGDKEVPTDSTSSGGALTGPAEMIGCPSCNCETQNNYQQGNALIQSCNGSWDMGVEWASNPDSAQITTDLETEQVFNVTLSGSGDYENLPVTLSMQILSGDPGLGKFELISDETSLSISGASVAKQVKLVAKSGTPDGHYNVRFMATVDDTPQGCVPIENVSNTYDITVLAVGGKGSGE